MSDPKLPKSTDERLRDIERRLARVEKILESEPTYEDGVEDGKELGMELAEEIAQT